MHAYKSVETTNIYESEVVPSAARVYSCYWSIILVREI